MAAETLYTLQDFPLKASIQAVQASADCTSYPDFYRYMVEHLPQNSPETRRRYANLIGKRYFPGLSLDTLLPQVWRAYHDEAILVDLMRVMALEAEPVIARFVLEAVWPLRAGQVLDPALPKAYIQNVYGASKQQSYKRLLLTMRHLGFLGRYNGQWIVDEIPTPANAFLLLLHDRLAPLPRIVRLSEVLEADWWRLLGLRSPEAVRGILRDAESAGLVARYARVDELEQVTTRFARDEYIAKAMRL